MSEAQAETTRAIDRRGVMPPERADRERQAYRLGNMPLEQAEQERQRQRDRRLQFQTVEQEWDFEHPCRHCGCIHFKGDTAAAKKKCCNNGAFLKRPFPVWKPWPHFLKVIWEDYQQHMSTNAQYYQNVTSIASIGVENGQQRGTFEHRHGGCVTLNGRVYLYYPRTTTQSPIYFYTLDSSQTETLVDNRADTVNAQASVTAIARFGNRIFKGILLDIVDGLLPINPYIRELAAVGDLVRRGGACDYRPDTSVVISREVREATENFEIGVVQSDTLPGHLEYSYTLRNGELITVPANDDRVEGVLYSLFNPYGESGFSHAKTYQQSKISFMNYLASRILCPDIEYADPNYPEERVIMKELNKDGDLIPTNRFQMLPRAKQYYLVESISRSEDHTLRYHRQHQGDIFGAPYQLSGSDEIDTHDVDFHHTVQRGRRSIRDTERVTYSNSDSSFLSASFRGSPRHLKSLAMNALAIVSELDRPTVFITLTCDMKWPEIIKQLLPHQTAYDREDVVNRVFKRRLSKFMHNLRVGKYFGYDTCIYIMHVIEYQHRGAPHAHIVAKLTNGPSHDNTDECIAWINQHIHIVTPTITENSSVENKLYVELVTKFQQHKCYSDKKPGGCQAVDGSCSRHYDKTVPTPTTSFDTSGFPVYSRPENKDLKTVPHNRQMLTDWKAHLNVEFSGKTYTVVYLYSYLFKGRKQEKHELLARNPDVDPNDEITLYVRARMLCAFDAMWRVLGYQTYPATEPSVSLIKAKLASQVVLLANDHKLCDLAVYFSRADTLNDMKYTTFFSKYEYDSKYPNRIRTTIREDFIPESDEFNPDIHSIYHDMQATETVSTANRERRIYVYKRANSSDQIVRMGMVYVTAGEIWYLRLLLLNVAAISFDDLQTVNGIKYGTFQAAAIARGFVRDRNEAKICYREAWPTSTPPERRALLVMLAMNGYPALDIFNDNEFYPTLCEDYAQMYPRDMLRIKEALLTDIAQRFKHNDSDHAKYGFESPLTHLSELQRVRATHNAVQYAAILRDMTISSPNTDEQAPIFDSICIAIDNGETKKILIQGIAGSGKTTFAKKIVAFVRSRGKIVLGCSSTNLAAGIFDDFDTAHSLFCYPVKEDEDEDDSERICNYDIKPGRQELLEAANVIIYDECANNDRMILEAALDSLNNFQDKVLIMFCDWRQIPPVIPNGTKEDIINHHLFSSHWYPTFEVYEFTINLRLRGLHANSTSLDEAGRQHLQRQHNYSLLCNDLGNLEYESRQVDQFHEISENHHIVALRGVQIITDKNEALSWLYGDTLDPNTIQSQTILATTNALVDEWNCRVQELNSDQELQTLNSTDEFLDIDDPNGYLQQMLTEEVLNKFNSEGVPPHVLRLKVGDVCMLTR